MNAVTYAAIPVGMIGAFLIVIGLLARRDERPDEYDRPDYNPDRHLVAGGIVLSVAAGAAAFSAFAALVLADGGEGIQIAGYEISLRVALEGVSLLALLGAFLYSLSLLTQVAIVETRRNSEIYWDLLSRTAAQRRDFNRLRASGSLAERRCLPLSAAATTVQGMRTPYSVTESDFADGSVRERVARWKQHRNLCFAIGSPLAILVAIIMWFDSPLRWVAVAAMSVVVVWLVLLQTSSAASASEALEGRK